MKFGKVNNDSLPDGSNPALIIRDNIIAVSGGVVTDIGGNYLPTGSGIGYSFDGGHNIINSRTEEIISLIEDFKSN